MIDSEREGVRAWREIEREGNEIVKRKKEFGGFKRHTSTVL